MVKTLVIDTELASITVHELSGFSAGFTSHLHFALAKHITGLAELPETIAALNDVLSPAGWNAVISYVRIVQQTTCVQWKSEPLFTLPSEYASYTMHAAAFDAIGLLPADFLKAWVDGIKRVSLTPVEVSTDGKSPGE